MIKEIFVNKRTYTVDIFCFYTLVNIKHLKRLFKFFVFLIVSLLRDIV